MWVYEKVIFTLFYMNLSYVIWFHILDLNVSNIGLGVALPQVEDSEEKVMASYLERPFPRQKEIFTKLEDSC